MARNNQKLINFHTSGNTEVPLESLFYGEIAVRHCSGDSAAELIIKNSENTSAVFVETAKMCIDCGTWDGGDSHEYVDLGLPSGKKWATCNIGAENPEDAGLYFQWGDTQGYTAAQVGTGKIFDWEHYKYSNDDGSQMTRYNSTDGLTELLPEDDAATANWGSEWKMPTLADIEELTTETTYSVDTVNNVSGMRFTGNGNSIFVPFAGDANGSNVSDVGREGYCWSSSLSSGSINNAHSLINNQGDAFADLSDRYFGFCVRPVRV